MYNYAYRDFMCSTRVNMRPMNNIRVSYDVFSYFYYSHIARECVFNVINIE